MFWSQVPDVSARRVLSFMMCLIYSFYLALRFNKGQLLVMFYHLAILILVSSLLSILFMPAYGIAQGVHEGSWRGVYFHKNGLGRISSISCVSTYFYIRSIRTRKWLPYVVLLGMVLLVVQSDSATSLVILFILYCLYRLLRWTTAKFDQKRLAITILSFAVIVVLLPISFYYIELLFSAIGRDTSFTGRIPLWLLAFEYIGKAPLLGYGYSAFWMPEVLENSLWLRTEWNPQQAHNGFIDVMLQLGLVGLSLFLVILYKAWKLNYRSIRQDPTEYNYWGIILVGFTILFSLTETFLLKHNNIYWVIFLTMSIDNSLAKKRPALYKSAS
ncbi:O-antigen ligase family protein [Nibrella saemangeumensis]